MRWPMMAVRRITARAAIAMANGAAGVRTGAVAPMGARANGPGTQNPVIVGRASRAPIVPSFSLQAEIDRIGRVAAMNVRASVVRALLMHVRRRSASTGQGTSARAMIVRAATTGHGAMPPVMPAPNARLLSAVTGRIVQTMMASVPRLTRVRTAMVARRAMDSAAVAVNAGATDNAR